MIIAYDTETYEYEQQTGTFVPVLNTQKFVLGCVKTDTGITKFFNKAEDMYDWITTTIEKNKKKKEVTYLYAHNAEYDWYAIAKEKLENDNTKYIIFNPFFAIHKEKGYLCDTMSFYKTSLAHIGTMLGFEKGKLPKRVWLPEELKTYLERDVEIVLKAILHLKEQLKKLGFTPRKLLTAGQVTMTCFLTYCRKNWTDNHFCEWNTEKKRKQVVKTAYPHLIREAYRGGDNQAHKIGKYKHDVLRL